MRQIVLTAFLVFTADTASSAPLERYVTQVIRAAAISPDGKRVALVELKDNQRKIVIRNVETGVPEISLNANTQDVDYLQWAGEHHLLITVVSEGFIRGTLGQKSNYFVVLDYHLGDNSVHPLLRPHNKRMVLSGMSVDTLNVVSYAPTVRVINGRPIVYLQGLSF